jgi:hypothetical protein
MGVEGLKWIEQAKDRVQEAAFVNMAKEFLFHRNRKSVELVSKYGHFKEIPTSCN